MKERRRFRLGGPRVRQWAKTVFSLGAVGSVFFGTAGGYGAQAAWLPVGAHWILDELLRVALCLGAGLLLILAVAVIAVVILRTRRGPADDGEPLEPPPYPSEPGWTGEPGADVEDVPRGRTADVDDVGMETEGPGVPPPTTVIDEEWDVGNRLGVPYEGRPSEPPGHPQPGSHPSAGEGPGVVEEPAEMSKVAKLVDRDDPDHQLEVARPVVTIGRAEQSDIVIDHDTVSYQHAAIKLEEGEFRIYDVGSDEGTFVDDERVSDGAVLEDGVVVRFGERAFVFHVVSPEA